MDLQDLANKYDTDEYHLTQSECDLPCFASRFSVLDEMNTQARIAQYIKAASNAAHNDVLVFSVTERDKCWKAWANYAKAHPKTFKVVQGGSIHGNYQCRMYIYTKPLKKRKHYQPKPLKGK